MFSDDATPIKGIILKIMETPYTPTAESGPLATAFKDKTFNKKDTLKELYAENIKLEAEITQKDFIIEELQEKLEKAETKAREQEMYFLEELTNKLKV